MIGERRKPARALTLGDDAPHSLLPRAAPVESGDAYELLRRLPRRRDERMHIGRTT